MMDANSLGRTTALSPVTWRDGWPYFGLPGNLGRTPRTWVKPALPPQPIHAPFSRDDDFVGAALKPIWQWNHVPQRTGWSLTERRGHLRLQALSAADLLHARDTLTQRAIGPRSQVTVALDGSGLSDGGYAGLTLFGLPYAQVGIVMTGRRRQLRWYDQLTNTTVDRPLTGARVWLRADCDFLSERAHFSWSTDGKHFSAIGTPTRMIFQTTTFQGVRFGLFAYGSGNRAAGHADFDSVRVVEPSPGALLHPVPFGRSLTIDVAGRALGIRDNAVIAAGDLPSAIFTIVRRPFGQVVLASSGGHVSVTASGDVWLKPGDAGDAETFQWMETVYGEPVLLSLATDRYLSLDPLSGAVNAMSVGPQPDGSDHARIGWHLADTRED